MVSLAEVDIFLAALTSIQRTPIYGVADVAATSLRALLRMLVAITQKGYYRQLGYLRFTFSAKRSSWHVCSPKEMKGNR